MLRLSAIGDVCHALPVARLIRQHLPETGLTWVIGKLEHQLLGDIEGIDFIAFDKRGGRKARKALGRQLQQQQFDALLHMQVALRASLVSRHIPARRRIGFDRDRARDWQWLFTNERIPARSNEHVMDGLLGFAEALGLPRGEPRWDIPVPADAAAFAEQQLGDRPTLVISPCSSQRARNFRNWGVDRYVAVARHARRLGLQVILTGGPSELERRYGKAIADEVDGCTDLVGRTTLKQLYALLAGASVVVSPDSGPVHMANAAGTPVVGLYATSNPDRTGPYFRRHLVANRYPDALQEFMGKRIDQVRWGQRVRHPDAMDLISVEDVTSRIDQALQEAGAAR